MHGFIKWILVRFLKETMGIQNSGSLGRPPEGRHVGRKSGRCIWPTGVDKDWPGGEAQCWGGGGGAGVGRGGHSGRNAQTAELLSLGVSFGESLLCCHPSWFWKMTVVTYFALHARQNHTCWDLWEGS